MKQRIGLKKKGKDVKFQQAKGKKKIQISKMRDEECDVRVFTRNTKAGQIQPTKIDSRKKICTDQ